MCECCNTHRVKMHQNMQIANIPKNECKIDTRIIISRLPRRPSHYENISRNKQIAKAYDATLSKAYLPCEYSHNL